jgi:SLAP domain-containing protein
MNKDDVLNITDTISMGDCSLNEEYELTLGIPENYLTSTDTITFAPSEDWYSNDPSSIDADTNNQSSLSEKSEEIIINKDLYCDISGDMTEGEIALIDEYIKTKINVPENQCQIYIYNVEFNKSTNEITVILFIYNNNDKASELPVIPLKIKDANDKLVISGVYNINAVVSPKKVAVRKLVIKSLISEDKAIDLSKWKVEYTA